MPREAANNREERAYDPELASESEEDYDDESLSSDGGSKVTTRRRAGGRSSGGSTSRQQLVQQPKRRRKQPDDPEKKNIRREKNREAARRCRKRKLDIVQDLESQVSVALDEYISLDRQAAALQALLASQRTSLSALEAFIKEHGTQRLDEPSPTPLSAEAIILRAQLLEESEDAGNDTASRGLRAGQTHGASGSHASARIPHDPASLPLPTKHAGNDGGHGRGGGLQKMGVAMGQNTQKQPHHAALFLPGAEQATAASNTGPPPPPTLNFDFPLPSAADLPSNRPHNLPPLQLSMPPPASPFAVCAATPTYNLKLLADQALHKLLHPSPYIHPTGARAAPFPPLQNDQQIPSFPLPSSLEQDYNLLTSPCSLPPGACQPPRTLKDGQAASRHHEVQSAGMQHAALQPHCRLSSSTPPGTKVCSLRMLLKPSMTAAATRSISKASTSETMGHALLGSS